MATEAIARKRSLTAPPTPDGVREKADAWRTARAQRSMGLKLKAGVRSAISKDEVQSTRICPVEMAKAMSRFAEDVARMKEKEREEFRRALQLYLGGQMAQAAWSDIVCRLHQARKTIISF